VFIDLTTKVLIWAPLDLSIRLVFLTEEGNQGYLNERGALADLCQQIFRNSSTIPSTRLSQVSCELRMGTTPEDALDAFFTLATADIVITSKSGFSHLAAVVSSGVKVMIPFWVVLDGISRIVPVDVQGDKGIFNETLFKAILCDYVEEKRSNLSYSHSGSAS